MSTPDGRSIPVIGEFYRVNQSRPYDGYCKEDHEIVLVTRIRTEGHSSKIIVEFRKIGSTFKRYYGFYLTDWSKPFDRSCSEYASYALWRFNKYHIKMMDDKLLASVMLLLLLRDNKR